jgi:formiminoglutamase
VDDLEDRDAFRWHQVIEPLDLSAAADELALQTHRGFCLLGYCCDHGVELNLGRTGAARGPEAIRAQLANLPVNFPKTVGLFDGGDIRCRDGDLEGAQRALAEAVERVLSSGLFPVVLGGGTTSPMVTTSGLRGNSRTRNGSVSSTSTPTST